MFDVNNIPNHLMEGVTKVLKHYKHEDHIVGVLEEKCSVEGSFKGRVLSEKQQGLVTTFTKEVFEEI